jgi:histone-binding protein RBBP4
MSKVDLTSKVINEQYKIWKKYTPFLYDYILSHALEWPSLTVEWLPERVVIDDGNTIVQRILLGTHTSENEPNYILILDVRMPSENASIDVRSYSCDAYVGQSEGILGNNQTYSTPLINNAQITQAIYHDGEINRARCMSTHSNIIASKGSLNDVMIFDRTQQPAKPNKVSPSTPQLRLLGHEKEGFGLAWNPSYTSASMILSGSDDKLVNLWDISHYVSADGRVNAATSQSDTSSKPADTSQTTAATSAASTPSTSTPINKTQYLQPLSTYRGHEGVIEDVQWNPHDPHICVSGDELGYILTWDSRVPSSTYVDRIEAHTTSSSPELNSIAYNPVIPTIFATGGGDHTVALWDSRNTRERLHSIDVHTDSVLAVVWAPVEWKGAAGNVLASASADRRVNVYDITKIGTEHPNPADAEDGYVHTTLHCTAHAYILL